MKINFEQPTQDQFFLKIDKNSKLYEYNCIGSFINNLTLILPRDIFYFISMEDKLNCYYNSKIPALSKFGQFVRLRS